ncbi:MAG: transcriptional regulator FtrA, partial [Rhodospirillaceae bacterium]
MYIGPMRIAILAYDGISPFMLSTPIAVFGEPFLATSHEVLVCGPSDKVSATGGLTIETPHGLEAADQADIVILPGWRDAAEVVPKALTDALAAAVDREAMAVGLCLGAFGVAE